jgi:hypothetical protein
MKNGNAALKKRQTRSPSSKSKLTSCNDLLRSLKKALSPIPLQSLFNAEQSNFEAHSMYRIVWFFETYLQRSRFRFLYLQLSLCDGHLHRVSFLYLAKVDTTKRLEYRSLLVLFSSSDDWWRTSLVTPSAALANRL